VKWVIPKIWKNSNVFVVGGGPSVNDLDLSLIHDRRVIGINCAFTLGHWIDITYFGDCRWWDNNKKRIADYACLKVTSCERLQPNSNLKVVKRKPHGFSKNPELLGWNGNSGASGINLAYLLGAKRAFLLGFDLKVEKKGVHNWHNLHPTTPNENIYETKFIPQFKRFAKEMKQAAPNFEVYNTNPDSALDVFPYMSYEDAVEAQ